MNVEVKSKTSGEKTVVPIDEVRKGIKYGKDLTGYEKNMLGNGIGKMESKDYVYTVINSCTSTNPVVANALAAQGVARNANVYEWFSTDINKKLSGAFRQIEDAAKLIKGLKDPFKSRMAKEVARLGKIRDEIMDVTNDLGYAYQSELKKLSND